MAAIPENEDRVSILVMKLENITNSSATEYMQNLGAYLQNLSLDGRLLKKPFQPDTSDSVVWVATLPIVYFLIVLVILSFIIGYVWYTQRAIQAEVESSGVTTFSRTSSRRNKTFTAAGTSLHDFFYDSKDSRNTLGSISKASAITCASCRSIVVRKNDNELISALWPYRDNTLSFKEQTFTSAKDKNVSFSPHSLFNAHIEGRRSHEYQSTPYKNNVLLSSQSYSTESLNDGLSRDSLRASMESHKLLRKGNSKIRPDDTYSWSDNTAYTTGMSGKKSKDSLFVYQNPGFKTDQGDIKATNSNVDLEDPLALAVDHFHLQRQNSFEISALNISSTSFSINNPTAFHLVPQNSELSLFDQSDITQQDEINFRTPRSDMPRESGFSKSNQKICRSLPPLPPNHVPRRNALSSPAERRDARLSSRNTCNSLSDIGGSEFDGSSLTDNSVDSETLSLPSSIAKFHASKLPPQATPRSSGFLVSTQNPTPEPSTEWCYAKFLKSGSPRHEDSQSICPNVGSFNHSFEISIPVASFLDSSSEVHTTCPPDPARKDDHNEQAVSSDQEAHTEQDGFPTNNEIVSPELYREGDAKLKRLISLDQLKSGKVSVQQRLRQFGYVRSEGHKNIYTNIGHVSEKNSTNETTLNSVTSSSEGRIENLTQEMKRQLSNGGLLAERRKVLEARPEIDQVLGAHSISSNAFNVKSNLKNITSWHRQYSMQSIDLCRLGGDSDEIKETKEVHSDQEQNEL